MSTDRAGQQPTTIRIDTVAGPADVEAWPCGVPGLLVTGRLPITKPAEWGVVHVRSGAMVVTIRNPEAALRCAEVFGQSGVDWTAPLAELQVRPEVIRMVSGVAQTLGATIGHRQAPAVDLNPGQIR